MDQPLRVSVVTVVLFFLFVSAGTAAASPAAPTTPIDSDSDDGNEDDRIRPSEQVPFGIRTAYGDENVSRSTGGDGITVAVIDTGVDRDHPDLENRVTLCWDFTGDRVRRDTCADGNGHGTHIAGTVAADGGDDDRGIYGVAPAAELYAFKACEDNGRCRADPLAAAVRGATDEGADVIVLSLGGRPEPRIQSATEYATDSGVIVIAAAGNAGPEIGSILYPAAHPNVIAVGAVGPRDGKSISPDNYRVPGFSGRGVNESFDGSAAKQLEIAAVGVGVLSPLPGGDYGTKTGTSMAAPHITGLAAKILAASPSMTVADLRSELRDRASRYDVTEGEHARPGYDPAAGFGVPTVSRPRPVIAVSPTVPTDDKPFVLDGTGSRSDAEIVEYVWDIDGDGEFERTGQQIDVERSSGHHAVTLGVTDAEGAKANITETVFVNDRPQVRVITPTIEPGANAMLEATVENEFGNVTVEWRFPDGTTAAGDRVTHRFPPGTSVIEVVVTDEFGATATERVTVTAPTPTVTPDSVDDQGPVFSPTLVLAVVVLAGLFDLRRRR